MSEWFSGRTAVVTGGASGIGLAVCRRLAAAGSTVLIMDMQSDAAEHLARLLNAAGGSARALVVDITDPNAVERALTPYAAVDILVNNAGIYRSGGIDDHDTDAFTRMIQVNLEAMVTVTRSCLSRMRGRPGGGRIVNVTSIQGLLGQSGVLSYAITKGGVANLTRALACDLAPDDITVNAVAPGFIDTPMCINPDGSHEFDAPWFHDVYVKRRRIPLARAGTPDDVAGPILFLAGPDAGYVTGQVLAIDGGVTATF